MMSFESPEELRIKVEMLRPVYDRCKKMEDGEDPIWEVKKKELMFEIVREARSFGREGSDANAAYVLGRIAAKADELDAPRLNIIKFNDLNKRYLKSIQQ